MPPSSNKKFSGIFVSYRRDDSSGHAGRLADRLVEHFGRNRIFMDIDTIEPGEDFVAVIENAVSSCDILIAVIGRNWLSASGSGRLDNPNNFVRLEIATALRRDIRVVPVLVQRASMPKPQDLPEDLVKLTRRNAVELTDLRWQTDVDQLITVMEKVLAKRAAVEVKHEAEDFRADRGATQRSEEPEEEHNVEEAPVDESTFVDKENRLDAPATIVTTRTVSPAYKQRLFMLIVGPALILLLAATILIWRWQKHDNLAGNTYEVPTPQPSVTPTPAKPTPTTSATPEPVAFSEPTLWKRADTGTTLEIVRNGNTLRATVDRPSSTAVNAGRNRGDLAFEGSYEGRTIKGTAYLLFSAEDVSRCPAFRGEQPFDLKLTLSADGNTLSGSREDFELSADCNIVNRTRRKLMYTRISR